MDNVEPARAQRQATGAAGELAACRFLESRGLHLLDAGWRCRLGELDLVMLDGDVLVFVEVRARQPGALVDPVESIDAHKRRRTVRAASAWLSRHPGYAALPARFDVVGCDTGAAAQHVPRWIRNAFDAQGHPT